MNRLQRLFPLLVCMAVIAVPSIASAQGSVVYLAASSATYHCVAKLDLTFVQTSVAGTRTYTCATSWGASPDTSTTTEQISGMFDASGALAISDPGTTWNGQLTQNGVQFTVPSKDGKDWPFFLSLSDPEAANAAVAKLTLDTAKAYEETMAAASHAEAIEALKWRIVDLKTQRDELAKTLATDKSQLENSLREQTRAHAALNTAKTAYLRATTDIGQAKSNWFGWFLVSIFEPGKAAELQVNVDMAAQTVNYALQANDDAQVKVVAARRQISADQAALAAALKDTADAKSDLNKTQQT